MFIHQLNNVTNFTEQERLEKFALKIIERVKVGAVSFSYALYNCSCILRNAYIMHLYTTPYALNLFTHSNFFRFII